MTHDMIVDHFIIWPLITRLLEHSQGEGLVLPASNEPDFESRADRNPTDDCHRFLRGPDLLSVDGIDDVALSEPAD